MERLVGQTTLIDTLGILLPGAVLLLVVNYYGFWDIALPWQMLFGEGDIPMLVYFAGVSYLCGSAIHELGAYVERFLTWGPLRGVNLHAKYWKKKVVQEAYQICFKKEPPVGKEKDVRAEQIKAGKEIFSYVQQGERPQRIILFTAFYTMSRALVLALTCAVIVVIWGANGLENALWPILICLVGIAIFFRRWRYFESKCLDEAYQLFIQHSKQTK